MKKCLKGVQNIHFKDECPKKTFLKKLCRSGALWESVYVKCEVFMCQQGILVGYDKRRAANFSDERVSQPSWWTMQSMQKFYTALKHVELQDTTCLTL